MTPAQRVTAARRIIAALTDAGLSLPSIARMAGISHRRVASAYYSEPRMRPHDLAALMRLL